jgi:hypothetical protein
MITFTTPNLDCETVDENDLRVLAITLRALASYADVKADAMRQRRQGKIERARVTEGRADDIYHQLPQWAKW